MVNDRQDKQLYSFFLTEEEEVLMEYAMKKNLDIVLMDIFKAIKKRGDLIKK